MDSFTAAHLQGVSRTYAILVPMLPRGLTDTVGLAYLLMRIVDTVEDASELSDHDRLARIGELEDVLRDPNADVPASLSEPIGDTADERALMIDAAEVIARLRALDHTYYQAAVDGALEMMRGVRLMMARAAERGRPYPAVRDAAEMREYCYYVAGVVGVMLNKMMAHYLRMPALTNLRDLSIELGIGLQLVNVVKDALTDAKHGRRYLPMVDDQSVSSTEIYRAALHEARASLRRGVEFVLALPATARELRYFCGLPIAWGAMTLDRAEREGAGAKISRFSIQTTIQRIRAIGGDDAALRHWLRSLLHVEPARETARQPA